MSEPPSTAWGTPAGYGPPPLGSGPAPSPAAVRAPFLAGTPVLAFLGFAVLVAGLFALPLNSYEGLDVGFVETRRVVVVTSEGRAEGLYSGLATFWWTWGAFIVGAVLVALLAAAIARVGSVAVGLLLTAVALVGGILHVAAMVESVDYRSMRQVRTAREVNFFDHGGAGIWVSIVGFAVVLGGGILLAATGRRR